MTDYPKRLMRRAWWRYFVLAFDGGALVYGILDTGVIWILGGGPADGDAWQGWVAYTLGLAGYLLVFYYSFREALREFFYEWKREQPESLNRAE